MSRPLKGVAKDQAKGPAPIEGGPAELMDVERASASPQLASVRRARVRRRAAVGAPVKGPLREVQSWFGAVISDPRSVQAGIAAAARRGRLGVRSPDGLERIVTAGPELSAAERLNIYHYAYHARLVDCLADDYPALVTALGQRGFERLARKVIAAHPSDGPNLNFYGRHLVTYLRRHPKACARRAFALDLAILEWAMVEVLHAQAAPVFSVAALQAIPAERWARMRLHASATVRILRFRHPVNAYLQAERDERHPRIPRAAPSATAVYRRGFRIWRMELTPAMADLLDALFAGRPLERALMAVARQRRDEPQQQVLADVMRWFSSWVDGGFFASMDG